MKVVGYEMAKAAVTKLNMFICSDPVCRRPQNLCDRGRILYLRIAVNAV